MADSTRRDMPRQHDGGTHAPSIPERSHETPTRSTLLRCRLLYAEWSIPTAPAERRRKKPALVGWQDRATTDRARITGEFNNRRLIYDAILTPTGRRFVRVILDEDEDGEVARLEAELGVQIRGTTMEVVTPSGNRQYHFLWPDDADIRNSVGKQVGDGYPGLDVRGEGGQGLMPPSSGYGFGNDLSTGAMPPELVEWMVGRTGKRPGTGSGTRRRPRPNVAAGEPIPEGGRNTTLFFVALDCKDDGLHRDQTLADLLETNASLCQPPLDTDEVERIVASAYTYPVIRRELPPEVREAVDALKRAWWATAWRGTGGKTERDVLRVLIEWAERYGHLVASGVRFTLSWRTLALAAACSFRTVSRVVPRLKAKGWLIDDNATRSGTEAGAFVLLPRPTDITRINFLSPKKKVTASDVTSARLPEESPCFRWRGFVGKGRAGVLYALEVFGPLSDEELADRLGWARVRDLRSRYLVPLIELGLVEDRGGAYALHGDHRERVEQVRGMAYGGGERKVRRKDASGRWVSFVRDAPATSEAEREELDRHAYAEERRRYAERVARNSPEADDECRELLNDLDRERENLEAELRRIAQSDGTVGEIEYADMLKRLASAWIDAEQADRHLRSLGFDPTWFAESSANGEGGGSGLLESSVAEVQSEGRMTEEATGRVA